MKSTYTQKIAEEGLIKYLPDVNMTDRDKEIVKCDALKELKETDRNLIYQRYYEEKTQTELAKEMNISQVKVYRMEKKILDELYEKIA